MSDNIKAFPNARMAFNQTVEDRDLYRNFFNAIDKVIDEFVDAGISHELMISALAIQQHILCQGLLIPVDE
jgi:hypothetical protein